MAHFRGTIEGNRGPASRLGTVKSGLEVTANGWDFGVRVVLDYKTIDSSKGGDDVAAVYLTSGSNGGKGDKLLGYFTAADLDE